MKPLDNQLLVIIRTPLPDYLTSKGIFPGIKVDTGAKELAGFTR